MWDWIVGVICFGVVSALVCWEWKRIIKESLEETICGRLDEIESSINSIKRSIPCDITSDIKVIEEELHELKEITKRKR